MALGFPRVAFMEWFVRGWTDVTSSVRQTTPVVITRGRANEQGRVAPGRLTAVMDNSSGDFSPSNPMGAYYGVLGRNLPVRWGLRDAADTFGRVVADDWGTTDTGDEWTIAFSSGASAANFDVDGTAGIHSVPDENRWLISFLPGPYTDVEVRVTVDFLPFITVAGNYVRPANIALRGDSGSYKIRVQVDTTNQVSIGITDVGGGYIAGPVTLSASVASHTADDDLTVVAQVEGRTIRAKVYNSTQFTEPYAWQVTATDLDMPVTGYVGVYTEVPPGNTNTKPIEFRYKNFQVNRIRISGEMADLRPRWDESHKDKWAEMKAAGILRRLEQGTRTARTAYERYVVNSTTPSAFWPLNNGALSTRGLPVIGEFSMEITDFAPAGQVPGTQRWGAGALAPWLQDGVELRYSDLMRGKVAMSESFGGSWEVAYIVSFVGEATSAVSIGAGPSGSAAGFWRAQFDPVAEELTVNPHDTTTTTFSPVQVKGRVFLVQFRATQNGANVDWVVRYNDLANQATLEGSGTRLATTLHPVVSVEFQTFTTSQQTVAVGYAAVWPAPPSPGHAEVPAQGFPGEAAGRRIERLCAEDDIPFSYLGDLDATAAMGPQGSSSLYPLLLQCEVADQGALGEARMVNGLTYTTREWLYNQVPVLTLDYSANQVSRPLEPTSDDQNTRNDVLAKRVNGGVYRATQVSGPLNISQPGTDADGVGRYEHQFDVVVDSDDQLSDVAHWARSLGTVQEDRYPRVRVNLAAPGVTAAIQAAVLSVNTDDRIVIENLTAADIYWPIDQFARGCTEVFRDEYDHEITFNCAPASPYNVVVINDNVSRWDSDDSTLSVAIDDNDLTASVAFVTARWTTTLISFPFNVDIGGEEVTVSGITGTTSPQTFTLSARSVNGVVKSHGIGTKVRLAQPRRIPR